MTTVVVIAENSLRWEPRAWSQVSALAEQGYDVTIFGVRGWTACDTPFSSLDGVHVVLVPSCIWARLIAALVLALPAVILGTSWLISDDGGLFDGTRPWSAWPAGLVSACGVAAGLHLLVRQDGEGTALGGGAAMRRWTRAVGPLLRAGPIERLILLLTSWLVWPLQDTISCLLIEARAVRLRPSVVHCHDIHTLHTGARIKMRTGAALIYDAHEIYEKMAGKSQGDAKRYRRRLFRCAQSLDGFVASNQDIAVYYRKHCAGLPSPVVIPNAKKRNFDLLYDGRMHRAAGLPPTQKILLYSGSLLAKFGHEKLAEIGFRLPPDWTVVLMGRGDLRDRLEDIARDTESVNATTGVPRVKILPPAPMAQLPAWICGATVGMISYEATCLNHMVSLPNKLWDYASVGVPILASDLPLVAARVRRTGMGWIISSSAGPDEIAAAISSLSEGDIATARVGCRKFMAQEGWARYEPRLLDLYERVLNHRSEHPITASKLKEAV